MLKISLPSVCLGGAIAERVSAERTAQSSRGERQLIATFLRHDRPDIDPFDLAALSPEQQMVLNVYTTARYHFVPAGHVMYRFRIALASIGNPSV
jgi:hypothetical protein